MRAGKGKALERYTLKPCQYCKKGVSRDVSVRGSVTCFDCRRRHAQEYGKKYSRKYTKELNERYGL